MPLCLNAFVALDREQAIP